MRTILLVVLLGVTLPASALTLTVGSTGQWHMAVQADINTFVILANATIGYVNARADVEGSISLMTPLRGGPGLSLRQSIGGVFSLGGQLLMLRDGTHTSGTWSQGAQSYEVELDIDVGLLGGLIEVSLAAFDGVVELSAAGGWAAAWVRYTGAFALPGGWELPFQPRTGEAVYRASSFLGQVAVRVSLPIRPGFNVGTEAGLRYAAFGVPQAEGVAMDLDRDGAGDRLDMSGLWIGLTISVAFAL